MSEPTRPEVRRKALDLYARSTVKRASDATGIRRQTIYRWAKAEGVEPGHKVPWSPGVAAWVDGCRCDVCEDAIRPVREAAHLYLNDLAGLRDVASLKGVSPERLRNWLDMYVGGFEYRNGRRLPKSGAAFEEHRRRRAERQAREEAERQRQHEERALREGVTCRCCGRPHSRTVRRDWALTCSHECAEAWPVLRYHVDEHEREKHQRAVASWVLRNPDKVNEYELRNARRVRVGLEPLCVEEGRDRKRRWLVEGSQAFEVAVRAYREGWPAFATWPQEIQRQVREHVDTEAAA